MTEITYSVSQFNQAVKEALESAFPHSFWITGELQRYEQGLARSRSLRWGQVYFELAEKKEGSDEVAAAVPMVLWREAAGRVAERLAELGGEVSLRDGLQVRFLCKADFYAAGAKLQLSVQDMDPHFTLGALAQNRIKLIQKLEAAGLLEKNKSLSLPLVPLRVGLITAPDSAAYHDFVSELNRSGFAFRVSLAPCRMQGASLESDLARAFEVLEKRGDLDAIVIIRGGGSRSDLSWFDQEAVALTVVHSSKPVLTGIGHQIDQSVADLAAYRAFKTPTACAQFLTERAADFTRRLDDVFARILSSSAQSLKREQNRWAEGLPLRRLRLAVSGFFQSQTRFLETLEARVGACDPVRLLQRGFCYLTDPSGTPLSRARDAQVGKGIRAHLQDGTLDAVVEEIEQRGGPTREKTRSGTNLRRGFGKAGNALTGA